MFYIVGLGNPGEEYENTRHNIGRMAIDIIAKYLNIEDSFKKDKVLEAEKAKGDWDGTTVMLLKPNTFMNRSGKSVAPIVAGLAGEAILKKASKIIVIHDDLDLPIGKIRVIFDRGSGGHKGVESIKRSLKTEAFIRIKIGVVPTTPTGKLKKPKAGGSDAKDSKDEKILSFILGEFQKNELDILKKTLKDVRDAAGMIVKEDKVAAMNAFN